MSSNRPRGTPGLLLLGFAVVLLGVALYGWVARARSLPADPPAAEAQGPAE